MGLFDKLFGSKENKSVEVEIYAPLSGEIVNIEDVPDVVFSEKIVGDGIAIRPTGNKIVAPVDGVIGKIFEMCIRDRRKTVGTLFRVRRSWALFSINSKPLC